MSAASATVRAFVAGFLLVLGLMVVDRPPAGAATGCTGPTVAWNRIGQIRVRWGLPDNLFMEHVFRAQVKRPTPVDVNGDGSIDLTATLDLTSTYLSLDVVRAPGATALPVAVEAVFVGTSAGATAPANVQFGFDAMHSAMPDHVNLRRSPNAATALLTLVHESGGAAPLALITSATPREACGVPTTARVEFSVAPGTATVDLGLHNGIVASVNRSSASTMVLVLNRTPPGGPTSTTRFTVDSAPSQFSIAAEHGSGAISYVGSSVVSRVHVAVSGAPTAFLRSDTFELTATNVPTQMALTLSRTNGGQLSIVEGSGGTTGQLDITATSGGAPVPTLPAPPDMGLVVDDRAGKVAVAARLTGLRRVTFTLAPFRLQAQTAGLKRFVLDVDTDTPGPATADVLVDDLPGQFELQAGPSGPGRALVHSASAAMDFLRVKTTGVDMITGTQSFESETNAVPAGQVSIAIPTDRSGLAIALIPAATGASLGQVRMAIARALPALVSDASYTANPTSVAVRDLVEFDGVSPAVAARLTGLKSADARLGAFQLQLAQDGARTRPLALIGTTPTGGPAPVVMTGLVNKPSAQTAVSMLAASAAAPLALDITNAGAVGSLVLQTDGLGATAEADVNLANVPTRLTACLRTDSGCRRSDRLPAALANYSSFGGHPAQNATAGGQNRPYAAEASVSLDDLGTSGTSSAPASMITLNAAVRVTPTSPSITLTNVRFHSLAIDVGRHSTSPSFSYLGGSFPRLYVTVDSVAKPFVLNDLVFGPMLQGWRIGTDASPATGNVRLAWAPGTKCVAPSGGGCAATDIDVRTSGSLQCGGQRRFGVTSQGFNYDLANFAGYQMPICS